MEHGRIEMLSKREREFIEDREAFENKYGIENARSVRARIRKKIRSALDDMIAIADEQHAYRMGLYKLREEYKNYDRRLKALRRRTSLFGYLDYDHELWRQLEVLIAKWPDNNRPYRFTENFKAYLEDEKTRERSDFERAEFTGERIAQLLDFLDEEYQKRTFL